MLDTPNYTPEKLDSLRRFFHAMNHFMVFMLRLGLGRMCEWWPEGFGRIMVIEHRGRRSGKQYVTPVNYAPVGGDVYCLGTRTPTSSWRVGIRHPRDKGRLFMELELEDKAIDTSGDYEKYFMLGGRRYSHIIDPRTGYPIGDDVVSATVIAGDATSADMLSARSSRRPG